MASEIYCHCDISLFELLNYQQRFYQLAILSVPLWLFKFLRTDVFIEGLVLLNFRQSCKLDLALPVLCVNLSNII